MGYDTDFTGQVTVTPPLDAAEVAFLRRFASTRHCLHRSSPYAADGDFACLHVSNGLYRGAGCPSVFPGNPGYWCQWEPVGDGTAIEWNGAEKFYYAEEWLRFLIDHFLKSPTDLVWGDLEKSPGLHTLKFHHVVNGVIDAQGEDPSDRWRLVVRDNVVTRQEPTLNWSEKSHEPAIIQSYVVAAETESGELRS